MNTMEKHRATTPARFGATMEGGQDRKTTKPKKWFLIGAVLSVVLLAAATHFPQEVLHWQPSGARSVAAPPADLHAEITRVAGSGLGFGPVVEATLPAARGDGETELLDLETSRWLTQPGLEDFNENVGAMMTWIRTSGANISGRVWPDGSAACVTYNMTMVPLQTSCWEKTAAGELPGIPALDPDQHSPSRLLVLGCGRTETYVFRTDEGTLGMLRLVGLSADERLVTIRYKVLQAGGETHRDALTRR
jgi:hypothetical protein